VIGVVWQPQLRIRRGYRCWLEPRERLVTRTRYGVSVLCPTGEFVSFSAARGDVTVTAHALGCYGTVRYGRRGLLARTKEALLFLDRSERAAGINSRESRRTVARALRVAGIAWEPRRAGQDGIPRLRIEDWVRLFDSIPSEQSIFEAGGSS